MLYDLQKIYLALNSKCLPVVFLVSFSLISTVFYSVSMASENPSNHVLSSYRKDFNRIDFSAEKERAAFAINKIPSFSNIGSYDIVTKERGDIDINDLYDEISLIDLSNSEATKGFDYFLNRMQILEDKEGYAAYVEEASRYINLLYDSKSNSIVLIKNIHDNISPEVIFEGIIRAAQYSHLLDNDGKNENRTTIDSLLSHRALIEGQVSVAQFLSNVQQNIQDKTQSEIIESYLSEKSPPVFFEEEYQTDFFETLRFFPNYYGLRYILKNYYSGSKKVNYYAILDNIPFSTHQVMHPALTIKKTNVSGNMLLQIGSDQKILFKTSCGELFIKSILDKFLPKNYSENQKITSGWMGDALWVSEKDGHLFFIWDTQWNTGQTAIDFVDHYKTLTKKRFPKALSKSPKGFEAAYLDNNQGVFIIKEQSRVIVFEGNIDINETNSILNKSLGHMTTGKSK